VSRPEAWLRPVFYCGETGTDIEKTATGLTAKGIKAAKLKRLPIAVPPLAEQLRIVARVDELMALCDKLEAQLTTAQSETRHLLDAVLYNALSDTSSTRPIPSRNATPNMLEVFEHASVILSEPSR
jgi:hypothetical protein